MRVTIREKNLEITPALRVYIEQKILNPARKLLKGIAETELPILDLEFSRTTEHHRKGRVYYAEATLTIGKIKLRASVEEENIRSCCDFLKDELENKIKRFKGRALVLRKRGARRAKKELHYDPAARVYHKGEILNEGE